MSLHVEPSRLVCVAGRSGSGKSTLLNIATGFLEPDRGVVHWEDVSVRELNADQRARFRVRLFGIVFQTGALIRSLTAIENVAIPGLPHGLSRDSWTRAVACLELAGVSHRSRHFPTSLSVGEAHRVALARALYRDPPILVLDEPTASLDGQSADSVVELLRGLRTSGKALLVASHDGRVIECADTLVRLD
ncbi:MAG: ATP-binding cassette domain-containing protein [Chloroflexi bacterium]|nr:ATP-binding cassette domain-containing protein [Chloroflexota bacterium]